MSQSVPKVPRMISEQTRAAGLRVELWWFTPKSGWWLCITHSRAKPSVYWHVGTGRDDADDNIRFPDWDAVAVALDRVLEGADPCDADAVGGTLL